MLQAYVDDQLHPVEAVAVADHLDACPTCSMEIDDYRLLKRLIGRLRREVDRRRLARLEATIKQLTERGAWDT